MKVSSVSRLGLFGAFVCNLFLVIGISAQERLLVNGKVFTANPLHPYAEAVALRDNKIVAVGNRGDVAATVSPSAEVIDLGGKMLLPGLIDSHVHAVDGGLALISTRRSGKSELRR